MLTVTSILTDFKATFPTTRIIVDGTEYPMKQPMALRAQATFSSYESRNTVTILVGSTPGGLVNVVSDAYGGCTSDRQIVDSFHCLYKKSIHV
jgi:hypothetical protein